MTGPRSSDSRRSGKGALWFESSVQRLEDQEEQILLEPEPPSERLRKETPAESPAGESADKRSK